jgi:hypothetical protein
VSPYGEVLRHSQGGTDEASAHNPTRQRCALVANRFEPEGAFTLDELSAVEALGAKIGDAILKTFPTEGA